MEPLRKPRARLAEARITMPESMPIRIIGFMNSPSDEYRSKKVRYVKCTDIDLTVTPNMTIREIKDFVLSRMKTIQYYQIEIEFWNENFKDAVTMQEMIYKYPLFMVVMCLHLHIIVPDEMFGNMYKTFRGIGMNEEKAKEATKDFMDTYQNKDADYEYNIASVLDKYRIKMEKQGKVFKPHEPFTPCE